MQELVLVQPGQSTDRAVTRELERSGTRTEFEARLAECGPLAYRIAQGVLRNAADAEDVAQEALLKAFRSFHRLRDPQKFRAWLVRIAFRMALDRRRSAKRREMRETAWSIPELRP
jgi:RNA polymerase sigma-70 factor (ECF subfamily)